MLIAWLAGVAMPPSAHAQPARNVAVQNLPLPEPIYWKQTLFQIPYQWSSAAEPGAAQAVHLLVSKDRGATWQKISEARPNVTSFNYRAEGDGEYWFSVRTIDRQGQEWPKGDYQPELRVVVDTTIPRIDLLQAEFSAGAVVIVWSGFDLNLDPASWRFEVQMDSNGPWLPVPPASLTLGIANGSGSNASGSNSGRATWPLPIGSPPVALRATVSDRAGNSATFRSEIRPATAESSAVTRLPAPVPGSLASEQPAQNPFVSSQVASSQRSSSDPPATTVAPGWVSGSDAATGVPQTISSTDQQWPPSAATHAPFRLWSSGPSTSTDRVTSYGNPLGIGLYPVAENQEGDESGTTGVKTQFAVASASERGDDASPPSVHMNRTPFKPLQPFRQSTVTQQQAAEARASSVGIAMSPIPSLADRTGVPPTGDYPKEDANAVEPKLVGSRTFALEYDLEDVGRWGVSKVELWGTRDRGQTWRLYAEDEDERSPLVVTVDDEGTYGFRIVAHSAGGSAPSRPQSGDAPELWVAVDLQQPVAELTAIERGTGNLADHLILYWRAEDDNLPQRPISLYYSSQLNGPLSTVAANLENTGQYAWRIERHVPERFYLRLEVRDSAGNVAAFRTREPIVFAAPAPSARLNSAESIDPTAAGASGSYR